jgi:hypothetical protein
MKRRDLLKLAALTATASSLPPSALALTGPPLTEPDPQSVRSVLAVFKCHLDVGFTNTQAAVVRQYFDVFYPAALKTAATQRQLGNDRYTWTTGAWLLYEYLEQATPAQRRQMDQAIAANDIAWHALPFNWQTEMLDPSLITGSLALSATLNRRFGRRTIAAKMSDVPGHSRGLISPLAHAGVQLLDIGVNAASTPPQVPAVFLWKDPAGQSLTVVYHHHDYGGTLTLPGTTTAFAMEMRNDNSGPHSPAEIAAIYAQLRAQFPNASVQAATLNDVALALAPVRHRLPVITQEIGDTWIYGIPSDPPKVARYRELCRLRHQWLTQKQFALGDPTDRQLLRSLLLAVEHTWGTDTKTYLDHDHYTPADLQLAIDNPTQFPGYRIMTTSWQEKRDDITHSVATLPPALRTQAEERLQQLLPQTPDTTGLTSVDPAHTITTPHLLLALDPATGAIIRLQNRRTGKEWATPQHPIALFTYQTLSPQDYAAFLAAYIKTTADWAPQDFGKPNIAAFGARSQQLHPTLTRLWLSPSAHPETPQRILAELNFTPAESTTNAVPAATYLEITVPGQLPPPSDRPTIQLRLTTLRKPQNRLPESMWLTFNPQPANSAAAQLPLWSLEKVGQPLAPADVVPGGSRAMHAISGPIRYTDPTGPFTLTSLDAPVVALGQRSPINFSMDLPDLTSGIHINLFNNAWGTNYPQWAGGDWSYRFTLTL